MTARVATRTPTTPSATQPDPLQRRKLRYLLTDAVANVPFYRQLYGDLGFTERDLADPDVIAELPILNKQTLCDASPEARRNERFATRGLALESTTGSTGQPFALYLDGAYRRRRNLRFLRALLGAGYRPWQRLMLLTDRYGDAVTRIGRRHYVSVEQPTEAIAEAWRRIRPHVLYGFATPLRLLAEHLAATGPEAALPAAVVSTAEVLDAATEHRLRAVFGCPVHDFYGLTEMGLVAWKPAAAHHYHPFPTSVLTEFLPLAGSNGLHRMIMTNLDLRAAPVIRFDSGDLASLRRDADTPRIVNIEGRRIDSILRADGSELSPYRVTDALRAVAGLRRFKVTQHETRSFLVELEAEPDARDAASGQVRAVLDGLLGAGLTIDVLFRERLIDEGARKFRPVESRVRRQ